MLTALLTPTKTAYANSAPAHWSGGTSFGTLFYGDGRCPLNVEHERLIFDVAHYPSNYYSSAADFSEYDGRVTAEYSFFNPESYDITATLMFPFGTLPDYAHISDGNGHITIGGDTLKYSVTVNGADTPKQLRHTYYPYMYYRSDSFDTAHELSKLSSEYIQHSFYSPDTPVTVYSYTAVGVPSDNGLSPYAAVAFNSDQTETKIIFEQYNGYDYSDGVCKYGFFVNYNDSNKIYAIGKPLSNAPSWTVYSDGGMKNVIGGDISLTSIETLTFEELALSNYDENGEVSKIDWYNAVVAALDYNKDYYDTDKSSTLEVGDRLMRWYEYELTVPAGGRAVNSVTAPIYPSIDGDRRLDSPVYGYTYLLSPARHWAKFGEIDIIVNTYDYIVSSNIDGFTKTENGYTATLSGLPDDELNFYLCADDIEYPIQPSIWSNVTFVLIIVVISTAVVVTIAVAVVRKMRQKRKP